LVIAYNLDFSAELGTANNYWYVIHIPTISNGVNFTVTHGLFNINYYDSINFLRTLNYSGAFDDQTTSSDLPGGSKYSTFNNTNAYNSFNFHINYEIKGFGIRANNTGDILFFFGVTVPELVYPHIPINEGCVVSLITNTSDLFISTSTSRSYASLPIPYFNGSLITGSSGTSQTRVYSTTYIGNSTYQKKSFVNLEIHSGILYFAVSFYGSLSAMIGKYSDDILYGALTDFPVGSIISVDPGVEEYFVLKSASSYSYSGI